MIQKLLLDFIAGQLRAKPRPIEWIGQLKQILDHNLEMSLRTIFLHLLITCGGSSMFLMSFWFGKVDGCNSKMRKKKLLERWNRVDTSTVAASSRHEKNASL